MTSRSGRGRHAVAGMAGALALATGACLRVEPVAVSVEPIHVTVDINVKVAQVDRALMSFYEDVARASAADAASAPRRDEAAQPAGERR